MGGSKEETQERTSVGGNPSRSRYLAFEVVGGSESAEEALPVSRFDPLRDDNRGYLLCVLYEDARTVQGVPCMVG